jgi:hypothetical protein
MVRGKGIGTVLVGLLAVAALVAASAGAAVPLTQVSSDPYTNPPGQHATQVEPDTFAFGSTIVATMQSGRIFGGGASNIGFATSTNGGASWTHGFLPGTTTVATPPGPYAAISDPSVAFDAKHNVWLINALGIDSNVDGSAAVLVNRSIDGGLTWGNPIAVATEGPTNFFDKNWIVCDNTATSPFFGSCYVEYDDANQGNQLRMAFSRDGGLTWTHGSVPSVGVIGGQPVVQPNGNVVMPIDSAFGSSIFSVVSRDGGVSWVNAGTIASISEHNVAGGLRTSALPSAEIDAAGKVYVVWQDCRFRSGCSANDIVMSTSMNGRNWSAVTRIPIDATSSTVDHFIPGIGVDPTTSGNTTKLGVTYYFYRNGSCSPATCKLAVGFISSTNAGATWSAPTTLSATMTLSWLPQTSQGRMVGDYISTSYSGGKAFGAFPVAKIPTAGGTDCQTATPNCDQATYTPTGGLAPAGGNRSSAGDKPVPGAKSDHPLAPAPLTTR